uniref:Pentatricopeptide repeat-containing protein At1g80880, mitochondrial n=1 Tax=Anthurium amnicola TaxID=1678845 RepID=A0A1D1XF36_9ARAE
MVMPGLVRRAVTAAVGSTARLLLHAPPPPPSRPPPRCHPPPTLPSVRYAFSSAALPPGLPHLSLGDHHLHTPLLSTQHNSFLEASDFEDEPGEPTGSAGCPELTAVLDLISRARAESSSKKEALAFLRASGVELTAGLVTSALWELRREWKSAILAFLWGEECLLDRPGAWHLMLWVLGKQQKFDIAWLLVRQMHQLNILTQRPFVILMERSAAANAPGEAIKTFHDMEKFKIEADSTALYALLRALCKHRNVEEAEELLFSKRKFLPLETEGCNIILDGWCNIIVDVVEAKRLWREMSSYCISPDGTSYTNMICCFSKVGNLFDSLRLYDEMKKRGWPPGLLVYNALIYVLTRESCVSEAKKLFDKVEELGLKANVDTYNSIIHPLCEAHMLDDARDMLDDMIEKGLDPTIETYHAFAKVEDMEGTLNLIKRMHDVGCGPNRYTFLLILEKFLKLGEAANALRTWREMRSYGIHPHNTHYVTLVQGLASIGWIPAAFGFYSEMKSKGFPASPKLERFFKHVASGNKNKRGSGIKGRYKVQPGKVS